MYDTPLLDNNPELASLDELALFVEVVGPVEDMQGDRIQL
jgi:hypothetical protein